MTSATSGLPPPPPVEIQDEHVKTTPTTFDLTGDQEEGSDQQDIPSTALPTSPPDILDETGIDYNTARSALDTKSNSATTTHLTRSTLPTSNIPIPPVEDLQIDDAQKHARWAISALNYEDISTAVKELHLALQCLGST